MGVGGHFRGTEGRITGSRQATGRILTGASAVAYIVKAPVLPLECPVNTQDTAQRWP